MVHVVNYQGIQLLVKHNICYELFAFMMILSLHRGDIMSVIPLTSNTSVQGRYTLTPKRLKVLSYNLNGVH